jgi:hypothetical protein
MIGRLFNEVTEKLELIKNLKGFDAGFLDKLNNV